MTNKEIPDYQFFMLPLLKLASDGNEHYIHDAHREIIRRCEFSEEQVRQRIPSDKQTVIYNRFSWAKAYLIKAGLLESTRRAYFRITDRGREVLAQSPDSITSEYLEQFPGFLEFKSKKRTRRSRKAESIQQRMVLTDSATPQEQLEAAYQVIKDNLVQEVMDSLKGCSPAFFERVVVDVLLRMGYGGSLEDAGEAIGGSGDEGIDGVIKEDTLGLDYIYIQAKSWESTVGRPDLQKFAGALQMKQARKGVFITTSDFSREAKEFVEKIESRIVLIDGEQLANIMINHNVGVSVVSSYEIKKLNSDYFEE